MARAAVARVSDLRPLPGEPRQEVFDLLPLTRLAGGVARPAQLGDPDRLVEVRRIAPGEGLEVLEEALPDVRAPLVAAGVGVEGDDVDELRGVPFRERVLLEAAKELHRRLPRIAAEGRRHDQRARRVRPDLDRRRPQVVGVGREAPERPGPADADPLVAPVRLVPDLVGGDPAPVALRDPADELLPEREVHRRLRAVGVAPGPLGRRREHREDRVTGALMGVDQPVARLPDPGALRRAHLPPRDRDPHPPQAHGLEQRGALLALVVDAEDDLVRVAGAGDPGLGERPEHGAPQEEQSRPEEESTPVHRSQPRARRTLWAPRCKLPTTGSRGARLAGVPVENSPHAGLALRPAPPEWVRDLHPERLPTTPALEGTLTRDRRR